MKKEKKKKNDTKTQLKELKTMQYFSVSGVQKTMLQKNDLKNKKKYVHDYNNECNYTYSKYSSFLEILV